MAEQPHRYLVTGGAGFIGSHLCDALLEHGHELHVLDDLSSGRRANLAGAAILHEGDIGDPAALRTAAAGIDGIFHLAAIASVPRASADWPGTHRVNQSGAVAVLNAARTASRAGGPVPVIYASSAAIYGDTGEAVASEELRPAPLTAYGADKLGCELHGRVATLVHGVPTLGLRFFNVTGARQDPNSPYSGVISIFARRIVAGQAIVLHGDGAQTRDFVHVSDVVAHLLAAMAALAAGTAMPVAVNVCTGRSVPIREVAERIAAQCGSSLRIERAPPRRGDIRHSRGSPAAAAGVLGLTARVTLDRQLATVLQAMPPPAAAWPE